MKNKSINYFLILIYLSIFSNELYGKCRFFDIEKQINEIPYLVKGIVVQSNKSLLTHTTSQEHHFTIKVIEVLKGNVLNKYLKVHYNYMPRKPTIITFDINDTYIFAIRAIEDGNATLFGTSCGRAGTSPTYTDKLKKAIDGI